MFVVSQESVSVCPGMMVQILASYTAIREDEISVARGEEVQVGRVLGGHGRSRCTVEPVLGYHILLKKLFLDSLEN